MLGNYSRISGLDIRQKHMGFSGYFLYIYRNSHWSFSLNPAFISRDKGESVSVVVLSGLTEDMIFVFTINIRSL